MSSSTAGQHDVDHIVSQIRRLQPEFAPKRALDFGCGVGAAGDSDAAASPRRWSAWTSRKACWLRRSGNVRQAGLTGVTFAQAAPEGPFDWLNSYIVFQHIQPETGYQILAGLLEKAARAAVVSLHLTVYRDKRALFRGIQESAFGRYDGENLRELRARWVGRHADLRIRPQPRDLPAPSGGVRIPSDESHRPWGPPRGVHIRGSAVTAWGGGDRTILVSSERRAEIRSQLGGRALFLYDWSKARFGRGVSAAGPRRSDDCQSRNS